MLRLDEQAAWESFIAANPAFAGELIASYSAGLDPPDVMCLTTSGRRIGVELTKWVEHDQVTEGKRREFFEKSYLKIVASETQPRPARIGFVWLTSKGQRVKPSDAAQFHDELFRLLNEQDDAEWDHPQGTTVVDFMRFPCVGRYLQNVRVFGRNRTKVLTRGNTVGDVSSGRWCLYSGMDDASSD